MLKKIWNGLSIISVVSWMVTLLCLLAIWILGTNSMSIRFAWNDISRICDSESVALKLFHIVTYLILIAGTTNIGSALLRQLDIRCHTKPYDENETAEEEES